MPAGWTDPELLRLAFLVAAGVSLLGILLVPWMVARLPADFFVRPEPTPPAWAERHPALHVALRLLRNLLGALLVLAGMAMLVLPGQGILTMLVGLGLLEFPGKRRVELLLVRRRSVRRGLDWIRRRFGRPGLVVDVEGDPDGDRTGGG